MVRIPGSHPGGPGSIPGNGIVLTTKISDLLNFNLFITATKSSDEFEDTKHAVTGEDQLQV